MRTAKGGPIATMAARRVKPIDPATELGSDSLDAPIEEIPFSAEAETDFEAEDEVENEGLLELAEALDEADEAAMDMPAIAEDEPTPSEGDELDLGGFSQLEEPEAVSSEPVPVPEPEPEPVPAQAPAATSEPRPVQAVSGIEKLRQTAPSDLSLVQLVERFAAALYEAQESTPQSRMAADAERKREQALAEALKALTLFTESGFAQPGEAEAAKPQRFGSAFGGQARKTNSSNVQETERELREALSKLQDLQGAA